VVTAKTMAAVSAIFPGNNAVIIASGVAAGLGCGLAVGLVNGFCVAKLKVSGFVVTLGTMSATAGVGLDGDPGTETAEPALGYWLGQPYWGNGYGREAVAAIIDYGFRTLGIETIRAYTDPSNAASQKVLLHCGLIRVGEIELSKPTRHGARRAPLFRISRPGR